METSDAAVLIQGMVKGRSTRQEVAERRRRDKAAGTLSRGGTQWLARRTLKAAQESVERRERDAAAQRMQAVVRGHRERAALEQRRSAQAAERVAPPPRPPRRPQPAPPPRRTGGGFAPARSTTERP